MTISVLLDTSFLISLVDRNRPNHKVAGQYYKYLIEQKSAIYLSAIVASEFAIKQAITDLPLKNFRILPFNITHSVESARLSNLLGPKDTSDNRAVVREDVKIMAQASHENIDFILTEDGATLFKYCHRLQKAGNLNVRAIKLADGFDSSELRLDGQKSVFSVTEDEDSLIGGEP